MYQPELITDLTLVALSIYSATVILYFAVLFFYGKYRKSPTLFWRSEPIVLVTEIEATQLNTQSTGSGVGGGQGVLTPRLPMPNSRGAFDATSNYGTATSSVVVGPTTPTTNGVRSILKRDTVYEPAATPEMVTISTTHYPKPMHQRWAEVILHTAAINAIQTIRGTITGTVFYGGAAMQIMFLTIYFEGSTEHNQLFVFLISCMALGAVICFIQKLRMTYHLNYLVMVLPRRDKTKEELDAEAVGLGIGKEDHTVHELRKQQDIRERGQEAIRTATMAAVAAVGTVNNSVIREGSIVFSGGVTADGQPQPQLSDNNSVPIIIPSGVSVDMNAESFKERVKKEIEAETREKDNAAAAAGGPATASSNRPLFASPVLPPVTMEQSFTGAITQVLGTMLMEQQHKKESERKESDMQSSPPGSPSKVKGNPGPATTANGGLDLSTRLLPGFSQPQSADSFGATPPMGPADASPLMLRRRGTLRDVFERAIHQLHEEQAREKEKEVSVGGGGEGENENPSTVAAMEGSGRFTFKPRNSIIAGSDPSVFPASPAPVTRKMTASASLHGSFGAAAAAPPPPPPPAPGAEATPTFGAATPQPSIQDSIFTSPLVPSPAMSENVTGTTTHIGTMRRSISNTTLSSAAIHKRSASVSGLSRSRSHRGGDHHHHHSNAKFQNVALLHMLTNSNTATTPSTAGSNATTRARGSSVLHPPTNVGPLTAAVAVLAASSTVAMNTGSGQNSTTSQTPNGSFSGTNGGPPNVSFETKYAAKLIAHLAVEEELSFRQHEVRLAEVLKLMSANYLVGMRLLLFLVPLIFGLFHDGALIGMTVFVLGVVIYMDWTTA